MKLARKFQRSGQELVLLTRKIKSFRARFKHHDSTTNSGFVRSPTLYSNKSQDISVKIVITSPLTSSPINFTCSVSTTIEHLISQAVCSMFDNLSNIYNMKDYVLKVTGKEEYFDSNLCLADYALVSQCCKFDLDVELTLIHINTRKRTFRRTSQDDYRFESRLSPDDLLSNSVILKYSDLNYEALDIIIKTFEKESERLYDDVANSAFSVQTQQLIQTTKAICAHMLNIETSQLTESKKNLEKLCESYKIESEYLNDEDRFKMIGVIQNAIRRLKSALRRILKLCSKTFPVDFELDGYGSDDTETLISFVETPVSAIKDLVNLKVHTISQPKPEWLTNYLEFHLEVKVLHGDTTICPVTVSHSVHLDVSFFPRLLFDEDLTLLVAYCDLAREARVVITLYGREVQPFANSSNQLVVPNPAEGPYALRRSVSANSIASTAPMYSSSPSGSVIGSSSITGKPTGEGVPIALATSVIYLFDPGLNLRQGDHLVRMHSLSDGKLESVYFESTADRKDPIVFLELKQFPMEKKIYFPDMTSIKCDATLDKHSIGELDPGVCHVLNNIVTEKQNGDPLMDDERSLLWENRLYLMSDPAYLPKVLLSVPDWSVSSLSHIYQLIDEWEPLKAVDALELLMPSFPDAFVREFAVRCISRQQDDELYDYMPQMIQALMFEKTLDCALYWLLLERALNDVRIAVSLYWLAKLMSCETLTQERGETLMSSILQACGCSFWKSVDKQTSLLDKLTTISNEIKKVRDGQRLDVLRRKLEVVQDFLSIDKPTMPWAPSLEICDIDIGSCSYFPSNAVPLKLAFRSCDLSCNEIPKFYTFNTIFKTGDDLRQDMLAIQMIRIMEKLWLREGLDLRIVTYDCLATNKGQGMVEMVTKAETLCKIQQKSGIIAGTFNAKAIDSYIALWNTSELEYETAVDNFLNSCAGYSVATYVLGICDRHNDNIMVTHSGHLFHIDFGKFLGDAQMLGPIKRDRTPFVLTPDMAYVINGGDRLTEKFQRFIELCTTAFNIIRRHRGLFINLFSLMSSAKIHGLNKASVNYIDKMLMPGLSEPEAMAKFTRLIYESLNSRSTQMNFFIHNMSQLRFSNNDSKQTLLSFVPKTFTIQTDGKIESLRIVNLYKKYEPEKNYYYVIRVKRYGQPDTSNISRTFSEFAELQRKLNETFPWNKFNDIDPNAGFFLKQKVGWRSNIREVAEQRLPQLDAFLQHLMSSTPEISECNLIYTFFHPLLRDQTNSYR